VTKQLADDKMNNFGTQQDLEKMISKTDKRIAMELYKIAKKNVEECSYNWIAPSFWQSVFGAIRSKQ
jgi:hypothetical protein